MVSIKQKIQYKKPKIQKSGKIDKVKIKKSKQDNKSIESPKLAEQSKHIAAVAKTKKIKHAIPPQASKADLVDSSINIKKNKQKNAQDNQTKQQKSESLKLTGQAKPTVTVAENKQTNRVMPSQAITTDLVDSSLNALLNVIVANDKQKNAIFDDEKPIFVEIHCIKIQNTRGHITFRLPQSTVPSTGEVCLVTPDIKKGRKHDHEPTIERWENILRNAGVTKVKTILPMRQLRVEYDQFELKRRLLTQHDFIMVDTRVLNHVSHLLGKMFFKKHNMLIPVRINEEKAIKKCIDIGLCTAVMHLGEGETATVTVGHTAMPQEKLKENILSLVQQLKTKYPGGEANIRAMSIKLPRSISLPLYLTLRSSNTVRPPKLTRKRPKHNTVLEDELSTKPGRQVMVAPDGNVRLRKIKKAAKVSKKTDAHVDLHEENDAEELDSGDEESYALD